MNRIERDKNQILNQKEWSAFPLLPMKRVEGDWNNPDYHTVLFSDSSTTLYTLNIWSLAQVHGVTWADVLSKFPQRKYESLDALLNDYTVD